MATLNRFNGESSGCRTPDPTALFNSGYAQKGVDSLDKDDSHEDAPGSRTPDRVAKLNIEALRLKLQELHAASVKKRFEDMSGPPPGLTPMVDNSLQGDVMKVAINPNLAPPFGTVSSSLPIPPPPPQHPDLRFVRQEAHAAITAKPAKPWMKEQPVVSKGSVGHPFHCAPACKYVKRKGGCQTGADCPHCHHCFWSRSHAGVQPKQEAMTQACGAGSDDAKLKEAQIFANKLVTLLGGEEPFSIEAKDSKASMKTAMELSVGTMGHPHSCAEPCKYVRRKGGCMHGEACAKCHACLWSQPSSTEAKDFGSRASLGAAAQDMQVQELKDGNGSGAGFSVVAQCEQGTIANPTAVISLNELLKSPPVLSTNPTWGQPQKELPASEASQQSFPWQHSVGSSGHPFSCGPACKYARRPKGCKDGRLCSHCHLCRWLRYGVKTGCKQPIEVIARASW